MSWKICRICKLISEIKYVGKWGFSLLRVLNPNDVNISTIYKWQ